jgi:hypothetical protein
MLKYLLRYLIFVGVPYIIAKKIEKAYLQRLKPKNNIDDKPESLIVDTDEKVGLYTRGGEIFTVTGIVAFLMKDLAFRTAITTAVGTTIWSDTADTAVEQIVKYASAIVAAPGFKFRNIKRKLQRIDSHHASDIKEILLDKHISSQEKLELIRLKVQYALKNLRGARRVVFITSVIALLAFFLGNGTPAFRYFMTGLREVIGGRDDEDTIKSYIVDIYREYNAPLPEELITKITNQL